MALYKAMVFFLHVLGAMNSVNTNSSAFEALKSFAKAQAERLGIERGLSSGLRVDGADQDASVFSVSQDLRSFLKSTEAALASLNAARGPLATALASGTMITDLLIDMKKLSIQAASVAVGPDQRLPLYAEFRNKLNQINIVAQTADFAGTNLLLGKLGAGVPPTLTAADAAVGSIATGGTRIVSGAFGPTGRGFAILNGTTITTLGVNANGTVSVAGTFTDPGGIAGVQIRAVDINNDGRSDVLIDRGAAQPAGAMVFQDDRTVAFINSSGPLGAASGAAFIGADFTGDTNPDVVTTTGGGLQGFIGGTSGGDVTLATTLGAAATAVESADFNGDGFLDLLADGLLYRGQSLSFQTAASLVPAATDYAAGDLNNDGRIDVVALIGGAIRAFVNLGDGRFFETTLAPVGGAGGNRIELADTTGDGNLDVIAYGAGSVNVALGDGLGGFGAFGTIAAGVGNDIALADIDYDGRTEIVATQGGSTSFIKVFGGPGPGTTKFVGDGRGTLAALIHQPMTSAGLSIEGISLERDGLAVINQIDRASAVAGVKLGSLANQLRGIDRQITFTVGIRDSTDVGLGSLVDVDLARQQAKFVANQVKLELNIKGLQIAKDSQSVLLDLLG